jgi:hypothetical protein
MVVINDEQKIENLATCEVQWYSFYMLKVFILWKLMGRLLKGKGELAMNEGKVRICWNVVGCSKKAALMWMTNKVGSWTVEVWNLWTFSVQSHSCTKSLSLVSQPQEFFGCLVRGLTRRQKMLCRIGWEGWRQPFLMKAYKSCSQYDKCHNYIITMWRSSLLCIPKCCSKNIL